MMRLCCFVMGQLGYEGGAQGLSKLRKPVTDRQQLQVLEQRPSAALALDALQKRVCAERTLCIFHSYKSNPKRTTQECVP